MNLIFSILHALLMVRNMMKDLNRILLREGRLSDGHLDSPYLTYKAEITVGQKFLFLTFYVKS